MAGAHWARPLFHFSRMAPPKASRVTVAQSVATRNPTTVPVHTEDSPPGVAAACDKVTDQAEPAHASGQRPSSTAAREPASAAASARTTAAATPNDAKPTGAYERPAVAWRIP